MSRSYDLDSLNDTIGELVRSDFSDYGYDVEDVEGHLNVTARITISLPDGWEFSGYQDSLEIERSVSF